MSVYFAQAGPYMKIGFSDNPFSRVGTVTTGGKRPSDLPRGTKATLIGWVPGDRLLEGGIHHHFAADHVAGEWFYLEPEAVREIIWADPAGIDVQRMSAAAVLTADKNPGVTRDEIAAAGISIEARSLVEVLSAVDRLLLGGAA